MAELLIYTRHIVFSDTPKNEISLLKQIPELFEHVKAIAKQSDDRLEVGIRLGYVVPSAVHTENIYPNKDYTVEYGISISFDVMHIGEGRRAVVFVSHPLTPILSIIAAKVKEEKELLPLYLTASDLIKSIDKNVEFNKTREKNPLGQFYETEKDYYTQITI